MCSTSAHCNFMAWESRGNRSYFYKKKRVGGKIKSVYIGAGDYAMLSHELEDARRNEAKIEKEKQQRRRTKTETIDEQINEISALNQSLVNSLFLLNGFYPHKRQWRKKRNG